MKNKWIKTGVAALAVICMVGCSAKEAEGETPKEIKAVYAETGGWVEDVPQKQNLMMPERQQEESAKSLSEELFDGQSMSIQNGKGNMLLALKKDTLYLYDAASARIKAETKTENWNLVTFYPYSDGYCAIGTVTKEKSGKGTGTEGKQMMVTEGDDGDEDCLGIFYDDSLKEVRRILLNDIVPNAAWDVWAVSSDGLALGYYDLWEGLNIYDLESQKGQKLLDEWKEGDGIDLLAIDALFFDEKNSHMVFTGQTNQDGRTVESWGRIGTDGAGLENHTLKHDFGMAAGYSGGKLLIGEGSIYFKGGMGIINTETKETAYHTDIDRSLPVSGPFFSADGTVFATAALDTNQMEVSVWQTADFSLLYKEVIRDDREEMFYRSPQICLFPEIRACIVCMGGHNDIPQKAALVNY